MDFTPNTLVDITMLLTKSLLELLFTKSESVRKKILAILLVLVKLLASWEKRLLGKLTEVVGILSENSELMLC